MTATVVDQRWRRAMATVVVLVGFLASAGIMTDNSLLTHLATGRLIIEGGGVPDLDPYSRFGMGEPWTVQSWLVSVVYAGLDDLAGTGAIRVFHGLIGGAIGRGLWSLTRPAESLVIRAGLALAPVLLGIGLWPPRPLLIGLAALVGLLCLRQSDHPGWLALPLMWVWANSHGSFPLGPGLLVLIAAGHWIDHRRVPAATLRLLAWTALGTGLAAIGPLGPGLLLFPFRVLADREAMTGVIEWEPPSFATPWELGFLALAVLPLIAARRGAGWARLLPVALVTASGFLALRNVAPASIVVVALLAPSLAPARRGQAATAGPVDLVAGPGEVSSRLGPLAGRLAVAVTVAAGTALPVSALALVTRPGLDLAAYPVDEIERLDRSGLIGADDVVLVHREAVGNYLIWRDGPGARVFVDDRFDFHDPELLADHRDLIGGRRSREVLDRWGVDVVVWQADGPLTEWLRASPEWSTGPGRHWVVGCRIGAPAEVACREAAGSPDRLVATGPGS